MTVNKYFRQGLTVERSVKVRHIDLPLMCISTKIFSVNARPMEVKFHIGYSLDDTVWSRSHD